MQYVSRELHISLCAISYNRNDVCRLIVQSMGQMLVVCDEMCNVDVAIVLFREYILSYLVTATLSERELAEHCVQFLPVDVHILKMELEDKVDQFFLDFADAFASIDCFVLTKQTERIH